MALIPTREKLFNPNWVRVSGSSYLPYVNDPFQRREPTKLELISSVRDTVYACVSLIARRVSDVPFKLLAETRRGQDRPKCLTRPTHRRSYRHKALFTDQVVEHPLIDLVERPNAQHTFRKLIQLTCFYLDTCGEAYWWIKRDDFGNPQEMFILPSYLVQVIHEPGKLPCFYYGVAPNLQQYDWHDVVQFLADPDGFDPYIRGNCPLKAVYERAILQSYEIAYLNATLRNNARPDIIATPKESISPIEAERFAKDFAQKFAGPHSGGIYFADQAIDISPIGWTPTDIAQLQLHQVVKQSICDAFHVPVDIFQPGQANRSAAEAAEYNLGKYCIKPRVENIIATLNHRLAPMFDDRLFFEAEKVEIEDRQFELQKRQAYLQLGVLTREEVREEEGYPSADWAKSPLLPLGQMPVDSEPINYLPVQNLNSKARTKAALPPPSGQRLADAIRSLFREQEASVLAALPEIEAKALGDDQAFDLSDWTDDMVSRFSPLVQVYADAGAHSTAVRLAVAPDQLAVTQPKIRDAVAEQTIKLAESTNATTSMELTAAMSRLRQELADGLVAGNVRNELMHRVRSVFERATTERAHLIAVTEASRAQHAAQIQVAKDSGLKLVKKWLLSADSCKICREIASTKPTAELDEPFAVTDYGDCTSPPLHPACRCGLIEEVLE